MSLPGFKPKEIKLYTIISVAISVAIIVFILLFTVNANTLAYLAHAQIRYEYFLAAILTNVVSWFLWGARVKILSQGLDKKFKISWWESTKIVIAHLFFSDLTPSMVGGEPVRIYLLNKKGMNLRGSLCQRRTCARRLLLL